MNNLTYHNSQRRQNTQNTLIALLVSSCLLVTAAFWTVSSIRYADAAPTFVHQAIMVDGHITRHR